MKKLIFIPLFIILSLSGTSFLNAQTDGTIPKLVVGVVSDPMGYNWIEKYWEYLGEDGLKKLFEQGASFEYADLNHYLAGTGPSHASLSTGSTPSLHGIIADSWYNRLEQKETQSTEDYQTNTVGSNSNHGKHSPRQLLTPTIGDALKSSIPGSKVISISMKPDASILMAGRLADGCYWFDPSSGNWITSSAYSESIPNWLSNINNKSRPDELISEKWDLYLSESSYSNCRPDNQEFEIGFYEGMSTFPYKMEKLKKASLNQDYEILLYTPGGNKLTTETAIAAIYNERLGMDDDPDLLMISYSAISALVNRFGPESREVMDAVLRLDGDIGWLLTVLEEHVGKENVVLFFTSTHGSSWNVDYAASKGLPAGRFRSRNAIALTNSYLSALYGENMWVESYVNQQLYLDQTLVDQNEISLPEIQEKAARFLNQFEGIASALPTDRMINASIINPEGSIIQNSFYPSRSGDISIILKPGWIEDGNKVADFTSRYPYDTRIPLVWWGMDISKKSIPEKAKIQDISTTLFRILRITHPISGMGTSLYHLFNGH